MAGPAVSYDFGLSESMWQRGKTTRTLGKAEMRYAAGEDIFILKLICPDDGQRRALVPTGVVQDDNAEVLGAKAGLLAGPTLEDY